MNPLYAQPGDTIEITYSSWSGERYVVVPPPERSYTAPNGAAWFDDGSGCIAYFTPDNYKIISRSGKASNNGANGDVDMFLNKQRDNNLHSVFG
jgi:hypothetical protein